MRSQFSLGIHGLGATIEELHPYPSEFHRLSAAVRVVNVLGRDLGRQSQQVGGIRTERKNAKSVPPSPRSGQSIHRWRNGIVEKFAEIKKALKEEASVQTEEVEEENIEEENIDEEIIVRREINEETEEVEEEVNEETDTDFEK